MQSYVIKDENINTAFRKAVDILTLVNGIS